MSKNTYKCGKCHYEFNHGVSICQGCHRTVVFGATENEKGRAGKLGAFIWTVGALFVWFVVLQLADKVIGTHWTSGASLGLGRAIPILIAAMIGYVRGVNRAIKAHEGEVRTF